MSDWKKQFDILTPQTGLFFEGRRRYYTNIGFFLSILHIVLVILSVITFFISFLKGYEMTFSYSKDATDNQITGNFSEKLFLFSIRDKNGKEVDSKYFEVISTYMTSEFKDVYTENLNVSSCPEHPKKELIQFDTSGYKCISTKNSTLNLLSSKIPIRSTSINIYVSKCKGKKCFSEDEINKKLKEGNLFFHFITESLTINNYKTEPIVTSLYSEKIPIFSNFFSFYEYKMKKVKYIDDKGIIINNPKIYEDMGIDADTKVVTVFQKESKEENEDDEYLLCLRISINSNYYDKYKRIREKLQNLFAKIGGVSTLFHFVMEIITKFFSKGTIIIALSEATFNKNGKTPSAILHIQQNYRVPAVNNFMEYKNSFGSLIHTQHTPEFGVKRKKEFNFFEVFCFRCIRSSGNCKYIMLCHKSLVRLLDVKNIITFHKEFGDNNTFEPIYLKSNKKETRVMGLINKQSRPKISDSILDTVRGRCKTTSDGYKV